MLTGGTALSYRKQDLTNQKHPAVGFSKLAFSHKAVLGDLGISLLSLTLPPELAVNGLSNPSGSELLNTNLLLYKNNITLVSSVRGVLQHGVSYLIPSSSQINFLNFTASDGEVFTGIVDYVASNGVRVVDGQAITASGVLGGDSRDFSVGTPFTVGKYLNAQVGSVLVFLDGILQKRNTGNSATVLDGSYYELDLGNGLGSVIRFNSASGTSRNVLVVSNGLLCDRPDGSLVASIEKLQGQINNMASYVATLAATSSTAVLGTTPTYLDLKTFGDRVISLESSDMTIKGNKTFSRPFVVQDGSNNTILSYSSTNNGFTLGKSTTAGAQSLNYLENGNSGVGQTGLVIRGRDGSSLTALDTSYLSLEDKVSGHANIIGMASYVAGTTNRYALEFRHVSDTGSSTLLGLSTKEGSWSFGTGSSNAHVFNGALSATTTLSIGSANSAPVSQLTNSASVVSDNSSLGVNSAAGLTWSANGTGWTVGVSNSSSSANSGGLLVKTSATDSATSILKAESGGATRVVFKSDGKVGIGTGSPAAGLDVASTFNLTGYGTVKSSLVQKYPSSTSKAQQFLTKNKTGQFKRSQAVATVSTWIGRAPAVDSQWNAVCWSPELGIFVAVANSGTVNRVMTSPDGITWTSRTSASDNNWVSVCWSAELGLFVAIANSGTSNRVMTSPDGITWTSRTSASDNNWFSICWSSELGIFVAVSYSGTGNRVMTSPDGINWTSRTSAVDNQWSSVCWSPESALFVAVAGSGSGTGNRVMTSPDGINWTIRIPASDNNWNSVCWSAELGLFVAVAASGTGNRVMTSPDGINWTTRTSSADNIWNSVCWSAELGIFVAVASSGIGNLVMTSPDGITWTSRTSAADNNWRSVCWSPELGIFVAVSNSGTANKVMTASYPLTVSATGDTTAIGNIKATGNIIASATLTASDERLKANIKTISDAVNKVMALRGVSFERNGKEQIGVIAQEVQKVLPQVVDVPDNANEYLAVSYGNIVGLLIEAMKDQQNQIEDLKKLVEARS
ncbi:Intramolecular chaperone auto-processing domain containing protein [uncultured Caudovirales phage]|uniref:Intramolecular chaperone auto-processing domain containing protein n=1 Tax=uncultured Caudovirales phage TaxID=2100421 RepID=A0A6J7WX40_9CAUD|nr:Intramolecular chaperone auto-processing domain containing protein [uncultured Caudovirales phage]